MRRRPLAVVSAALWRVARRTVCAGLLLAPSAVQARQVAGEVRGRVIDATDRVPVAGAQVELEGTAVRLRTASDGSFHVRSLDPRGHRVRVQALGYRSTTVDVQVVNARVSEVEISLARVAATLVTQQVRATQDTAAFNAQIVDRASIERSGARDVADVLQNLPGVVITRSGGPGQPSRVSMRGSSANQVLVLLDGVPLNSALSGAADLSLVPVENVERITVLTGAQSARYGPRAMAGVIEVVTRRPRSEQSLVLRTGALGEWGAAAAVAHQAPVGGGQGSWSLGVDHRATRGDFRFALPAVRGGGWARRENADVANTQVVAGASLEGRAQQVVLRATYGHTRRGMAGSIVQPSLTGRQVFDRASVGTTAQHTQSNWVFSHSVDAARESAVFADATPPFGAAFDNTTTATTLAAVSSATRTWRGVNTAAGVEWRHLGVRANALASGAPTGQTLLGSWMNARREQGIGRSAWRWTTEGALRADHSTLLDGVAWSPRVATQLARSAWSTGTLSMGVSYGAGFAPPTLADQFFQEGVQVRANPALRPERTRHDMEVRLSARELPRFGALWHAEAASYRADVDGMILWLPDFRFIWSPSNHDATRRGWELRGGLRIPRWHLDLQGGLDESRVSYAGGILSGQVAYRPRRTANLQIGSSLGATRAEFVLRHVGVRRVVAGSALNALPAYRMADARLSTEWQRARWTLQPTLAVENLFSRQAAMLVDYPFPTRLWSIALRLRPPSPSTLP